MLKRSSNVVLKFEPFLANGIWVVQFNRVYTAGT